MRTDADITGRHGRVPDAVELERASCPCGCAPGDDEVLKGWDRLHSLPGEFNVVRCRSCGLMRTDPRPTPETIGFYYTDDYGPHVETRVGRARARDISSPSLARRVARTFVRLDTQRVPKLKPGRMLEIGCASGAFLHKMGTRGWEVEGVESSEKAAAAARALGYRVFAGPIEEAPDPEKPYDLIVGWMVLEHLHDPVLALRKLERWTRPDGWLAVSVPNARAAEFRLFGNAWFALQLPTHLFHYTPRTLRRVLELGGWKMEKVFHQRVLTNLIMSAGYRVRDRDPRSRLAPFLLELPARPTVAAVLYPIAFALSLCGQTGRMTVWARRASRRPEAAAPAAPGSGGPTGTEGRSS